MRNETRDIATLYRLIMEINKNGKLTDEQKLEIEDRLRELTYKGI